MMLENDKRNVDEEQLKAHSLPGTNQAGKGADEGEQTDRENGKPGGAQKRSGDQEQLDAHSLPGTNQAGKGPGGARQDDPEN
jgi:hypothetical protein